MGRLTPLHEKIVASYTLDELRVLCGSLNVPYEHLRGETLPARALSLLHYADKRGKLPDLVAQCAQDFPELDWQTPPPRQPGELDDDDEQPDGGVSVNVKDVSGTVNIGGVADVKHNTGQVAVGSRNVIQIGSLNVPRWLVIALPVLVVSGLIIAGLGTARIFDFTRAPTVGPLMMTGAYNIAVAQFADSVDTEGRPKSTPELGGQVSRWVFDNLQSELKGVANTQLWHDSLPLIEKGAYIGVITGTTAEERQATAQALAERIGADLVIYGAIQQRGGPTAELEPEFYVAQSAVSLKRESEAEDVVGSFKLGAPVAIPIPIKGEVGLLVNNSLESRAVFVRGLLFDLIGLHDKALEDFRRIQGKWTEDDERALLNFFLGREALFIHRSDARAQAVFGSPEVALDEAERNFTASLQDNPDYALGNWGLGTTLLRRVEPGFRAESIPTQTAELLDQAIAHYETAVRSTSAAGQPLLLGKMKTSLANAHSLKGELDLDAGRFAEADALFKAALAEVDEADALIGTSQPRHVAIAHWVRGATLFRQGAMQKFDLQDMAGQQTLEKAKAEFEACLNTFDDPQTKTVLDQTLKDFQVNNCRPDLDQTAIAIETPAFEVNP